MGGGAYAPGIRGVQLSFGSTGPQGPIALFGFGIFDFHLTAVKIHTSSLSPIFCTHFDTQLSLRKFVLIMLMDSIFFSETVNELRKAIVVAGGAGSEPGSLADAT